MYRLPLAPLLAAAGVDTHDALARCAGFSRRSVQRWANAGLSAYTADAAAIAIGSHPINVWGFDAWWESAVLDQLVETDA